jgi:DNA repair protein RadC
VCRETATELSHRSRFENVLPRYRIMLVKESEDTFTKYPKFQNSHELFDSFREELAIFDHEHFCMITLDSKNRTIGYHTISVGSLSTSVVHPRLCFIRSYVSFPQIIGKTHTHSAQDHYINMDLQCFDPCLQISLFAVP